MTDVFISYKRDDRTRCANIADALRALGLDVWFDARLESGVSFDAEIERRIHESKAVLVLWSPLAAQSTWVRNEATIGVERGVLVSAELEPTRRPVQFTTTHTEPLHDGALNETNAAWVGIVRRIGVLAARDDLVAWADRAAPHAKHAVPQPKRAQQPSSRNALFALLGLAALTAAGAAALFFARPSPAPSMASTTPIPTGAPAAPASAMQDPCVAARGDWEALAGVTDLTMLENFLNKVPAACTVQQGLARARIQEIKASTARRADAASAAQNVRRAFSGAWAAAPDNAGECGMLPWRFERTETGFDRISKGGDREPFVLTGAAPPTLRHSGGLRIVVRGDRMVVIPQDGRAQCALQRQ